MPTPHRDDDALLAAALRLIDRFLGDVAVPRWRGLDNVPREGGVIIAANHPSGIDPVALTGFLTRAGRIPRFLARAELFSVPWLGRQMARLGQIPVLRDPAQRHQTMDGAVAALERGECVVIYPEGQTSRPPQLWPTRARSGAARMALITGAPVIPVAVWGTQFLYDHDRQRLTTWPKKTVTIAAGEPVDLADLADEQSVPGALRIATDRIMDRITRALAVVRDAPLPLDIAWRAEVRREPG